MRNLLVVLAVVLFSAAAVATDLSGTWSADVVLDAGSGTAKFVLKQEGNALSGTYSGALGEAKVSGSVKGDDVEWSFDSPDAGKIVYKGKIAGEKIKGTVEYGDLGKGSFSAERKK